MRAEPVLALAAGPRLLLVRRRRLVYGVDVERVAEVRVRVAGLRVRDGLIGRREVRGLEVRAGRVSEGGRRAVEVLADRGQVRQPGVPIAAAVVPFLVEGKDRGGSCERMTCVPPKGIKCPLKGRVTLSSYSTKDLFYCSCLALEINEQPALLF